MEFTLHWKRTIGHYLWLRVSFLYFLVTIFVQGSAVGRGSGHALKFTESLLCIFSLFQTSLLRVCKWLPHISSAIWWSCNMVDSTESWIAGLVLYPLDHKTFEVFWSTWSCCWSIHFGISWWIVRLRKFSTKFSVLQALAAGLLADHNVDSSVPYPPDHEVPTERIILARPDGLSGQGYLTENFI